MSITHGSKRRPKSASVALRPPMDDGGTVAGQLKRLGNIPASRVRLYPTAGTATEDQGRDQSPRSRNPAV
jgi:hypothetical protein